MATDPFEIARDRAVPGYPGVFIPHFQGDYSAVMEYEVCQDGMSLGFKVKQVAPWKRWACDLVTAADGAIELIDQLSFEEKMIYIQAQGIASNGDVVALERNTPAFEAKPRVERWIQKSMTEEGVGYEINFDPHKPAPQEKVKVFYTREGEEYTAENATQPGPGEALSTESVLGDRAPREVEIREGKQGWWHAVENGEVIKKGRKEAIDKYVAELNG